MNADTSKLVSKVHPLTREVAPEDPMELYVTRVAGDPEVMLRCVVQEYAWIGWGAEQILGLFHDPFYPALHHLLGLYGESELRDRVVRLLRQTGVFHCRASVREALEPDEGRIGNPSYESEPELIQLGIRTGQPETTKGESHAAGL